MRIAVDKITALFIDRNIVSEGQQEIYRYGLELIFADAINFAIILLTSIWLSNIGVGLIYSICFVSTRIFCGGFHADTYAICRISMFLMFCGFTVLYHVLDITQIYIIFLGLVIAWIPIIRYTPVIHKNKSLSHQYRKKNRKKALFICGIWTFISVVFILSGIQLGVAIAVTLWIVSASIIWGKVKLACKGGRAYEWSGSDSV